MTTFLEDESSVQDGRPREGYEIVLPAVTYRITSADTPLKIGAFTYTPDAVSRSEIDVPGSDRTTEVAVTLRLSHPFAQRWLALGAPPRRATITIYRLQQRSGVVETVWQGLVLSATFDRSLAKFQVASVAGEVISRRLPTVVASRICPHILYDNQCTVDRDAFKVATTVAAVDATGKLVTLASDGGKVDQFFQFGELVHGVSGEQMTILSHVGDVVTLQMPIFGLAVGNAVDVFAGCQHDIFTCHTKFDNHRNFGGFPQLPRANPFLPTGYGVFVQT